MKLFFDMEFTGLHQNTTLISLGIISEDGRSFYAEFNDYDKAQVDEWLQKNVIDNLVMEEPKDGQSEYYLAKRETAVGNLYDCFSLQLRGNTEEIKKNLLEWLAQFEQVEFWSDCLAYDWVLLNGLLADFSNGYPELPKNVNYIPFDICTLFWAKGIDADISREEFAEISGDTQKHNALWDARVIQKCFEKLQTTILIIFMTRNEEILQMRQDGWKLSEIGKVHGLSKQRVAQIIDEIIEVKKNIEQMRREKLI